MLKKTKLYIFTIFVIILSFSLLYCGNSNAKDSTSTTIIINEKKADNPVKIKAAMIIAPKDFRDEELFDPKKIIEDNSGIVDVYSKNKGKAKGMLGMKFEVTRVLKDLNVKDYDVIIFVGGAGSKIYWNDKTAQKIAKETVKQNKILAAICLAPVILANSDLLKGKKATCWKDASKQLEKKGAEYTGDTVTIDGNIITGNGPEAAKEFGEAIIKKFKENDK